jgi:hypothetical protein
MRRRAPWSPPPARPPHAFVLFLSSSDLAPPSCLCSSDLVGGPLRRTCLASEGCEGFTPLPLLYQHRSAVNLPPLSSGAATLMAVTQYLRIATKARIWHHLTAAPICVRNSLESNGILLNAFISMVSDPSLLYRLHEIAPLLLPQGLFLVYLL